MQRSAKPRLVAERHGPRGRAVASCRAWHRLSHLYRWPGCIIFKNKARERLGDVKRGLRLVPVSGRLRPRPWRQRRCGRRREHRRSLAQGRRSSMALALCHCCCGRMQREKRREERTEGFSVVVVKEVYVIFVGMLQLTQKQSRMPLSLFFSLAQSPTPHLTSSFELYTRCNFSSRAPGKAAKGEWKEREKKEKDRRSKGMQRPLKRLLFSPLPLGHSTFSSHRLPLLLNSLSLFLNLLSILITYTHAHTDKRTHTLFAAF